MQKVKIEIKDKPIVPMKRSRFLLVTPKKISLIIFVVFLVLVGIYFWRQISFLTSAPKLEIIIPPTDITTTEKKFEIIGKTESSAYLTINGLETYIDKEGNFKAELNLSEGVNTIKIESKNRFNKVNTIIRRIIYEKANI